MSISTSSSSGARFKDIFPGGFDDKFGQCVNTTPWSSISRYAGHFVFKPEQLYYSLVERRDPDTRTDSIVVRSAWYGKQTNSANHEFLLFQVEDIHVPGLVNYLILDRDAGSHQKKSKTLFLSSSQMIPANDSFKVSYDGNSKTLLRECQLSPNRFLEHLAFPSDKPLYFYELVTLANVVSHQYPKYETINSSCYFFAGIVWECLRLLRPSAHYEGDLAWERGKCRWVRFIPSELARQEAYHEICERLRAIEQLFLDRRTYIPLADRTEESEDQEE